VSDLPIGWQLSRLNELCEWGSGGTPRRSEASYFGGAFPWITISDLNDGRVNNTAENLTESGIKNSAAKLVPEGTVLVALYGSIGKLGITTRPSTTNQAIACALPNEQAFDHLYLFHYLRSKRHELGLQGTGVTQKNIYLGDIKAFEIPVAPRVEQTRIVAKLEELLSDLDAGVVELKAAQKKLAQYRQSLLKAAVEGTLTAEWRAKNTPKETAAQLLQRILTERRARWEAKQLAKFKEQGKNPPKDWQKKYPEPVQPDTTGLPDLPDGWVWASVDMLSPDDLANGRSVPTAEVGAKVLRLTAVIDGAIDLRECKVGDWSKEDAKQFAVVDGDLLIVRGNGSLHLVGRAGLVENVTDQVAYPDTMIRLRVVDAVVSSSWIGLVWNSQCVRTHLERRARTSAGIYKIAQPDIVSAPIPVPSLSEQAHAREMFKQQMVQINAMQTTLDVGLKQSTAQRQNILRAAFSGQLVPQDPSDEPASELLSRIRADRTERVVVKKPRGRQVQAL
jgi:type I restriction enzyme S subunit